MDFQQLLRCFCGCGENVLISDFVYANELLDCAGLEKI